MRIADEILSGVDQRSSDDDDDGKTGSGIEKLPPLLEGIKEDKLDILAVDVSLEDFLVLLSSLSWLANLGLTTGSVC